MEVPITVTQEHLQPPDLAALMGEREIEIYGFQGKLNDLLAICPLDPDDPRMNLEAKNEVIIIAINDTGGEIEPELETYFTKVLEEQGEKPNFTIIEPVKEKPPKAALAKEEAETPVPVQAKQEIIPVALKETTAEIKQKLREIVERVQPSIVEEPDIQEPAPAARKVKTKHAPRPSKPIRQVVAETPTIISEATTPIVIATPETPVIETPVEVLAEPAKNLAPIISSPAETIAQSLALEVVPDLPQEVQLPTPVAEYHLDEEPVNFFEEDWLDETPAAITQEIAFAPEPVVTEEIGWSAEIFKEPLEIYENFTESLQHFVTASSEEKVETVEPVPIIVELVATRLEEIEEADKDLVAPILKNIVGAIHGLHVLEAKHADPEAMAVVEAQLEELCITLFETLGIEYTEEDVQKFMHIMLDPDFRPQPAHMPESVFDLALVGTHEAKRNFSQLSGLSGITHQVHHVLGIFVLFCVRKPGTVTT